MRLKIYENMRFGDFFACVFWLSLLQYVDQFIYLMLLVSTKSTYQESFNQKIYLEKNLAVTVVCFCFCFAMDTPL